jgi:hypothetical protein
MLDEQIDLQMGELPQNDRKITFSLSTCILPFFGRFKEWRNLMTTLCKNSFDLWHKNINAFAELNNLTKWADYKGEVEDLMEKIYRKERKIDKPPVLCLFGYEELDKQFIRSCSIYRLPNIKEFQLQISKFIPI